MATPTPADVAVVIGRFQPFHNGHASLLRLALETAPKVTVVLGSSFHARSAKNPFTWKERAEMIATALSEQDKKRVTFIPLRDYYEDTRWANAVRKEVAKQTNKSDKIALVGHFKDASSYYLNHFPQWQLVAVENELAIDATSVRRIVFEAEDIDVSVAVLDEMVPATIRQYLKAWTMLSHYKPLQIEYFQVKKYKADWERAPYPPIFSTVDAVVVTAGHVLLIKRNGFPGKGTWALPGGFVDQRERLIQAAIRELVEETQLGVLESMLMNALVDVKVFDHPDRSQRGRTITHAHYFDLRSDHLPEIEGSDDAAEAAWIPIAKLASMEEVFFEDHFNILDHFLKLTAEDV